MRSEEQWLDAIGQHRRFANGDPRIDALKVEVHASVAVSITWRGRRSPHQP
jgi:hypothetical protein